MWVCQSKWETTRKVGVAVVKELLGHAKAVQAQYDPPILHTWIFAHEGLTKGALELAKKEGVFWSNRAQLDGLLSYLGLRQLPEILDRG